ncbi:MAG: TlyA family RNA methyltransferase [Oscillospiraceae bacterium]|nr:TlyA family RNA methyltransferase [Oscillospiraceae bacterium]
MPKIRLDLLLTGQGHVETRTQAQAVIMSGVVFLDGKRLDKPGTLVPEDAQPEIRGERMPYVSRGGLKLEKALASFDISPAGKCCIDCGASTGGFTDCLLQNGSVKVYAVDVGYGQLDWRLRQDERVVVLERTNVRHLTPEELIVEDDARIVPQLAAIDLSFISLRLVLPAIRDLLAEDGEAIALIKPQFEAGREQVGKKGVVRDPAVHRQVLEAFLQDATAAGFGVQAIDFSPIKGPEGNIEYLGHLKKGTPNAPDIDIPAIVASSHM